METPEPPPVVSVDASDIIQSLTGQVAAKAGEVALLEAKVLALSRLLEPSVAGQPEPEVSDEPDDPQD